LIFSNWLPATHTSVAYRLRKLKYELIAGIDAMTCGSAWI
jgi:hypothetical protein